MSTDQPAQGSTADYCSRWPGEPHHMVISVRGNALVSVSRCSLCGWIDFDDLREQALALIADGRRQAEEVAFDVGTVAKLLDLVHQYFDVDRGVADPLDTAVSVLAEAIEDHTLDGLGRENARSEGRRQATEGWERKWAIDSSKFIAPRLMDSEAAARGEGDRWPALRVVSRLVGPWEPAEQPDPITLDRVVPPPLAIQQLDPATGGWELAFDGVLAAEQPEDGAR